MPHAIQYILVTSILLITQWNSIMPVYWPVSGVFKRLSKWKSKIQTALHSLIIFVNKSFFKFQTLMQQCDWMMKMRLMSEGQAAFSLWFITARCVCLWIRYSMIGGWWMLLHQTTTQGVANSSSTYRRGARERWTKGWGVAAQHKANQQTYRFNSVDQQHLPLCCNHQKPERK